MGGNSARVYLYRVRWNKEKIDDYYKAMNGVESIREMLRRNPDKLNRRSGSR